MKSLLKKGDKKVIRAWAMYDWANSVYSLVITSAIFPIYFGYVSRTGDSNIVQFLGMSLENTALYSFSLSFAFLVIAAMIPLLSSIADYSGNKKGFMQFFCYLGSLSCIALFFYESNIYFGILCFMLAAIGFTGSIVFYNAYLPEIAEDEDQDRVSAQGFSMGYVGSVILLLLCFAMIMNPEMFGMKDPLVAMRWSFLLTGLWWIGFAQITFYRLPSNVFGRKPTGNILFKGYRELTQVWSELGELSHLKIFLLAFFSYTVGVQTVMYLAASFGNQELALEDDILIGTILIIQLVAIPGAYGFARLSKRLGNVQALVVAVAFWIVITGGAYFVYNAVQFMIVGAAVGLVMGGIQSLSRSTYSKFLPETLNHASYFSFFDVCEKVAIVLGTFLFGLVNELTGSMRNSLLVLIVFFVVGLLLLLKLNRERRAATK